MAKRTADTQITKDSVGDSDNNVGFGAPQRANAAQMANRKLAKPRGVRRPQGVARPAFGLGATSSSVQQEQQSFPPFGQTNGTQQSSFSFGQSASSTAQNPISQSFPPFGPSSNQNNSGTNTSFTAPSGGFSFHVPEASNPFSMPSIGNATESQNAGFQGSIFKYDAPATPPQNNLTGEAKPLFSSGMPNGPSTSNAAQEQPKAPANGFTWPQVQQQPQNTNGIFSFSSTPQQQPQSVLANAADKSTEPMTNIFAGIQSPLVQSTSSTTGMAKPDVFEQLTGASPDPATSQAAQNPFTASAAKPPENTKDKPFANLFGSTSSPSTNPFSTIPTAKVQSQPSLFPLDAMQTSPDNTPQKGQQTPSNPLFQFPTQPTNPAQTSPTKDSSGSTSSGSLFDRASKPPTQSSFAPRTDKTFTLAASEPSSSAENAEPTTTASKPFGYISDQVNTKNVVSRDSTQEMPWVNQHSRPETQNDQVNSGTPLSRGNADSALIDDYRPHDIGELPQPPASFTLVEKRQVYVGWRLRQLDSGMQAHLANNSSRNGIDLLNCFYDQSKRAIIDAGDGPVKIIIPAKGHGDSNIESDFAQAKKPRSNAMFSFTQSSAQQSIDDQQLRTSSNASGSLQASGNTNTKRKASDDLTREGIATAGESTKRSRGSDFMPKSQTSNLFSSIVDSDKQASLPKENQNSSSHTAADAKSSTSTNQFQPRMPKPGNLFGSLTGAPSSSNFFQKSDSSVGNSTANPFSASKPVDSSEGGSSPFQSKAPSTFTYPATTSSPSQSAFGAPTKTSQQPETDAAQQENDGNASSNLLASQSSSSVGPSAFVPVPSIAKSGSSITQSVKPSTSAFTPKSQMSQVSASPVRPPKFNINPSTDFMAQFGEAAKKEAVAAKEKRKAEDYDSDEDDEQDWDRKDAEQQQQKKQKIEEAAKAAKHFVPNLTAKPTPQPAQASPPKSIFDTVHPIFNQNSQHNSFGHLAKKDVIENARNTNKDSDEEHEGGDTISRDQASSLQSAGRSLFDRISKPEESSSSSVGNDTVSEGSPSADHTWKADSPIKFGGTTSSMPSFSVTGESPSKLSATGLFGAPAPTSGPPSKPGASIFSNLAPPSGGSAVGFGFGPAKGAGGILSQQSSRATSPGATTGESATESATETPEDSSTQQEQLDLMSQRAGEENEDVIHEVRAKALRFNPKDKDYSSRGVGPLRVLKHRETGKRRIILRMDPSGSVVINSGFIKQGKYENIGSSTVRCGLSDQSGEISIWHIRVKANSDADKLAQVFNESKESGS